MTAGFRLSCLRRHGRRLALVPSPLRLVEGTGRDADPFRLARGGEPCELVRRQRGAQRGDRAFQPLGDCRPPDEILGQLLLAIERILALVGRILGAVALASPLRATRRREQFDQGDGVVALGVHLVGPDADLGFQRRQALSQQQGRRVAAPVRMLSPIGACVPPMILVLTLCEPLMPSLGGVGEGRLRVSVIMKRQGGYGLPSRARRAHDRPQR